MMGLIWSGIVTGALYALGALGLVLIFKSSKVLNFAFGNQAGLAAFIVYALVDSLHFSWGASVALAFVASIAVAGILCVAIYPIALKSEPRSAADWSCKGSQSCCLAQASSASICRSGRA
jgi:branched-chain amino acid transport system permease protein